MTRAAVVDAALTQLGKGDPPRYWRACGLKEPFPKHWCGGLCLWALKEAGLARDWKWKIGLGFLYKLPQTKRPKPGDIAYFHQPFQHHAIVASVDGTVLHTIDGNQPDCRRRTRVNPVGVVYYSIQPLLDAAEASEADTEPAPPPSRDGDELRMGARGPAVAEVQRTVGAVPDGIWGPKTDEMIRNWQRKHRLLADGVWDDRCRRMASNACE